MKRDTILCLCDYSGVMAEPWVMAGYTAILIDPQHQRGVTFEGTVNSGQWLRVGHEIDHPVSWQVIRDQLPRLAFVVGFPPCTDVSLSGTRWWAKKAAADRYFQCRATRVAEQCQTIGNMSGAPWIMENPMSAFSRIFRQPDHKFHPFHYTGWEPDDNYRKETWLWCGGGFVMPPAWRIEGLDAPDSRIHHCPPGAERANIRSATPRGFARAVFNANGTAGQPSAHPPGPKAERWVLEIERVGAEA